jgi:hypothetical protein
VKEEKAKHLVKLGLKKRQGTSGGWTNSSVIIPHSAPTLL